MNLTEHQKLLLQFEGRVSRLHYKMTGDRLPTAAEYYKAISKELYQFWIDLLKDQGELSVMREPDYYGFSIAVRFPDVVYR